MPRITELQGYRFTVIETEIPNIDPADGQPRYDITTGTVKLLKVKQIILFDQLGDHVKITLPDEARQELVRQLTGDIVVPEIEVVKH